MLKFSVFPVICSNETSLLTAESQGKLDPRAPSYVHKRGEVYEEQDNGDVEGVARLESSKV